MKFLKATLFTIVFVYAVGVSGLYAFQSALIFKPGTQPPNISVWNDKGAKEIKIQTYDGLKLTSWYKPPENNKPVILFFHGNTGSIENRAFKSPYFTENGYGVLLAEYRGYGGNAGKPSEKMFFADALAYMDWLNKNHIADQRIILYGESLGSGVATYAAAQRNAQALILEAPFTSIEDLAKAQYPIVPVSLLLKHKFRSIDLIDRIDMPLLILHGTKDIVVPNSHGKAMYEKAKQPKIFNSFTAGHNDLYDVGTATSVLTFLRNIDTENK